MVEAWGILVGKIGQKQNKEEGSHFAVSTISIQTCNLTAVSNFLTYITMFSN